jgi:hypothetical protein
VQEQNDAHAGGGGGGAGEDRPFVRPVRRLAHRNGVDEDGLPWFLVVVGEVAVLVKAGALLEAAQRGDGRQRDAAASERVGEVEVADLVGDHQPPVPRPDQRHAVDGDPDVYARGGAVQRGGGGIARVEQAGRLTR